MTKLQDMRKKRGLRRQSWRDGCRFLVNVSALQRKRGSATPMRRNVMRRCCNAARRISWSFPDRAGARYDDSTRQDKEEHR